MELNIKDRLYLREVLPQQNSFSEFALKKSIIDKVAITQADIEKYSIVEKREEGKIEWNTEMDQKEPLVVDFSQQELDYLKKGCEALVDVPKPDDFWLTIDKIYGATLK